MKLECSKFTLQRNQWLHIWLLDDKLSSTSRKLWNLRQLVSIRRDVNAVQRTLVRMEAVLMVSTDNNRNRPVTRRSNSCIGKALTPYAHLGPNSSQVTSGIYTTSGSTSSIGKFSKRLTIHRQTQSPVGITGHLEVTRMTAIARLPVLI